MLDDTDNATNYSTDPFYYAFFVGNYDFDNDDNGNYDYDENAQCGYLFNLFIKRRRNFLQ